MDRVNGSGAAADRKYDLAVFDALPHSVKEVLWYALPNLSSATVERTRKQWSLSPAELREEWENRVREYVLTECRITYGSQHPQARKP